MCQCEMQMDVKSFSLSPLICQLTEAGTDSSQIQQCQSSVLGLACWAYSINHRETWMPPGDATYPPHSYDRCLRGTEVVTVWSYISLNFAQTVLKLSNRKQDVLCVNTSLTSQGNYKTNSIVIHRGCPMARSILKLQRDQYLLKGIEDIG